jgi:hypothetical protein
LPAGLADPSSMQHHAAACPNDLMQLQGLPPYVPASDPSTAAPQGHLEPPASPKTAAAQAAITTAATAPSSKGNASLYDVQPSTAGSSRPRPPALQQLPGASPRSPQTASKLAGEGPSLRCSTLGPGLFFATLRCYSRFLEQAPALNAHMSRQGCH